MQTDWFAFLVLTILFWVGTVLVFNPIHGAVMHLIAIDISLAEQQAAIVRAECSDLTWFTFTNHLDNRVTAALPSLLDPFMKYTITERFITSASGTYEGLCTLLDVRVPRVLQIDTYRSELYAFLAELRDQQIFPSTDVARVASELHLRRALRN